MKYGPIPTTMLERLALWAEKAPIPVMDSLFSIMKARGLMAGVSLGVFEAIGSTAKTPDELAKELQLDASSLELLLRCMVWAGYLKQSGNRYRLSPLSRKMAVNSGAMDLSGFVNWNYVQWRMVEQLETLLKTGRGVDFHSTMAAPQEWAWYQEAMLDIARLDAPFLAKAVPVVKGARRLLDVGGSHGLLGAAICRKHPPMRSLVIELPSAIGHARILAKKENILDIVDYRPGNILETDFGVDNDVVLLGNILHHFLPHQIAQILKRLRGAVSPGGTIAIWDLETPDPNSKPNAGDGAALYFRLTSTAQCYSGKQLSDWLSSSGFERRRICRPVLRPGYILVTGGAPLQAK